MSELWRAIAGFEGLYEVSSLGRVRSLSLRRRFRDGRTVNRPLVEPRVLGLSRDKDGYRQAHLYSNGIRVAPKVHALVLRTFIGPRPPGHEAAHLNGDRTINSVENLAWLTHPENEGHKRQHGTVRIGERNNLAKLTGPQVEEIRVSLRTESCQQIAQRFGVHVATVRRIADGRTWALSPPPAPPGRGRDRRAEATP